MTIKQQGGIFGRNPTFNDIEAENLSITSLTNDKLLVGGSSGELESASGISYNGSALTVDATTYLDGDKHLRDGSVFINNNGNGSVNIEIGDTNDVPLVRLMRNGLNYIDMPATAGGLGVRTTSSYTTRLEVQSGGDVKVNTGNLIIGTSGKGIDFSATSGTGTSELFSDYEEGTFTPTTAGDATGAFLSSEGYYTKIGRLVAIEVLFKVSTNFTANAIGGLPYTVANLAALSSLGQCSITLCSATPSEPVIASVSEGGTQAAFSLGSSGSTHAPNTTQNVYRFCLSYMTT